MEIEGRAPIDPKKLPEVTTLFVSDGYFEVLGLPMRQGRALRDPDGKTGSEGIVVNARFASQFFPGDNVIGKRIRLKSGNRSSDASLEKPWLTIVGVAATIRQRNLQQLEPDAAAYLPYRLEPPNGTAILIRSLGDPGSLTAAVRDAVQAVDPNQPVFDVQTMTQLMAQGRWPYRVFGSMFTIFAIIALVLASVGIYAVTAYSVTQRTQEIGVRMALGAQASQVSWLILRQGLVQLVIGLAIGTRVRWLPLRC